MPKIISREEHKIQKYDGIIKHSISQSIKKVKDFVQNPFYHEVHFGSAKNGLQSPSDGNDFEIKIPGILIPSDISDETAKIIFKKSPILKRKSFRIKKNDSQYTIQIIY